MYVFIEINLVINNSMSQLWYTAKACWVWFQSIGISIQLMPKRRWHMYVAFDHLECTHESVYNSKHVENGYARWHTWVNRSDLNVLLLFYLLMGYIWMISCREQWKLPYNSYILQDINFSNISYHCKLS